MKNRIKIFLIITLQTAIFFTLITCAGQPAASGSAHSHSGDWAEISLYAEARTCGVCGEKEIKLALGIGDTGPGGGIVFYLNAEGFTVTDDNSTAYYLEASPENLGAVRAWASPGFIDSNYGGAGAWTAISGTSTDIGAGRKNTALILAVDSLAPAALACKNYAGGGKNDWFLPSKDELNELYKQRSHFGITSGFFWTSSQLSEDWALGMNFAYGTTLNPQKNSNGFARAVRAF